ncbi:MAG: DDE-type integrase/transposase/recombinase [Bifidobacteriaceae bacterium]|jgi:transposase InsO family protein|nr:DDE-type integrase/transposase/recombinase [Bifidobacteriaceae bacterium]
MRLRKAIVDFDAGNARRGAVRRFCEANSISRSVFYKIRARARALGQPGVAPSPTSRAPKTAPSRTSADLERLAVETRAALKKDGWDCGPISVRSHLIRAGFQDVPSRATLARIFARNGMVTPQPAKRPRASYKRFCHPRPNDMWQLDGVEWRLDDEKNTKQVIYQVEDDHSRMILAWATDTTENGQTSIEVVSEAIKRHGVPARFLTDNGSAFNQSRRGKTAPLERYLKAFGVKPISGQIAKPTTQGKNERLHLTLQQFLEAHRPITTPDQLAELLDQFADHYNNHRHHQELPGLQTPAEAYAATPKADPPPLPAPAQPDLFDASDTTDQRPATPKRRKPDGAYQVGPLTMADRAVGKDGRISIAHCQIYVGRAKAGQTMRVSITDDHLEIFGPDGDALGIIPRPTTTSRRTRINLYTEGIYCG